MYAFSARPGLRVELVQRVRREADEQRAGHAPGGEQPDQRDADELEHSRRASARADARQTRAPGRRRGRRRARSRRPARRAARAAQPSSRRAAVGGRGGSPLSGPNASSGRRAAGRGGGTRRGPGRWRGAGAATRPPRRSDPRSSASTVMRASHPEPRGRRKDTLAGAPRERALARERLSAPRSPSTRRISSRAVRLTSRSRRPDARANAATARSAPAASRAQVADEIRVAEQQAPGLSFALSERERLPLASTWESQHPRPGLSATSAVPSREPSSATITSAPGNSLSSASTVVADSFLLVARGDENGYLCRGLDVSRPRVLASHQRWGSTEARRRARSCFHR